MARKSRRTQTPGMGLSWQAASTIVLLAALLGYFHAYAAQFIWEFVPPTRFNLTPQLERMTGYVLALVAALIGLQAAMVGIRTQYRKSRQRRIQRSMMKDARHAAAAARTLDELEWRDFEYLVGQIFQEQGYKVEVQEGSGDGGVDIIMRNKQGQRLFVQCKHWRSTNVGAPTVREMAGTVLLNKVDRGAIVCSGRYTKGAYKEAEALNILLVDGKQVMEYLGKL